MHPRVLLVVSFLLIAPLPLSAVGAQTCTGVSPVTICIDDPEVDDAATLHVGSLGVSERAAYAYAEGGLALAAGAPARIVADYAFEESALASGESLAFVAYLRVVPPEGMTTTTFATQTAQTPGAFAYNGTLEILIQPSHPMAEGWSVYLEAHVTRYATQQSQQLSNAYSAAPVNILSTPEPATYAGDVRVASTVHVGSASANTTEAQVQMERGLTVVATDTHVRFTSTAVAEKPAVSGMEMVQGYAWATLAVSIPGGPSYGQSRTIFEESCNDWSPSPACSMTAGSHGTDLGVMLPLSALRGATDVTASLGIGHIIQFQNSSTGQYGSFWQTRNDEARVVVIGGGL